MASPPLAPDTSRSLPPWAVAAGRALVGGTVLAGYTFLGGLALNQPARAAGIAAGIAFFGYLAQRGAVEGFIDQRRAN